jgi:hypothetical protein
MSQAFSMHVDNCGQTVAKHRPERSRVLALPLGDLARGVGIGETPALGNEIMRRRSPIVDVLSDIECDPKVALGFWARLFVFRETFRHVLTDRSRLQKLEQPSPITTL